MITDHTHVIVGAGLTAPERASTHVSCGKNGQGVRAKKEVDLRTGQDTGRGPGATEIVAWRRMRLRRAGFDDGLADQLSRECAVDLHALIELAERGCPPPLAARILAPLEHEKSGC